MIKSLEAQGLQLAKEKQEYLGWPERRIGLMLPDSSTSGPGAVGGPRGVSSVELSRLRGARHQLGAWRA